MPIHDWTRVDAGLFHAFHQRWISALCDALNTGGLPRGYFALPEQNIRGPIPDVLTLQLSPAADEPSEHHEQAAITAAASAAEMTAPAPGAGEIHDDEPDGDDTEATAVLPKVESLDVEPPPAPSFGDEDEPTR